ncbi:glycerophosphodiester phosphodiesterase family protein [Sphingobacterium sp. SGR-19]|uniref:glycerophosphodiester phosphodiesterase family protein n=1 Tax=Sphingobacterium sp. SGR-19 TaxID=2710886 RepID=UPI0013EBF79D|nr:glycerophosphodiester phosphodiesterase family protein [Sphingobacterium sp. SGR-19]NGM65292.1 glycerophosphodiester phosphodiesterase [Sphingobacterium sp. SGR-19]
MTIKKRYFKTTLTIGTLILLNACGSLSSLNKQKLDIDTFPTFSYEGHRGARGLYPENSIGAMKTAIDLPKVTTLEMDCHITKDNKVVVYHDHYLNPKFVQYTDGRPLSGKDNKGIIYDYNYAELAKFDIGSKFYEDFPEQKKIPTSIALLSDLIDEAEIYAKDKRNTPIFYNIETKSKEGKDGEYHPNPQEFSDLLLQVIADKGIAARTVIQSFDKRTIQYINRVYPQIKTSYLVGSGNKKSIKELVDELGYTPFIISPHYSLATPSLVRDAHKAGIKVVPWTVNDKKEIEKLEALRVDGIISDYPNLF